MCDIMELKRQVKKTRSLLGGERHRGMHAESWGVSQESEEEFGGTFRIKGTLWSQ